MSSSTDESDARIAAYVDSLYAAAEYWVKHKDKFKVPSSVDELLQMGLHTSREARDLLEPAVREIREKAEALGLTLYDFMQSVRYGTALEYHILEIYFGCACTVDGSPGPCFPEASEDNYDEDDQA